MANVLGALFGDIANAIREKSGETATMKPVEFPDKIRAIEVGGGSSADVRYVTFMSYDGSVEYGRIPVAVGYDCPNPKFATPTRESTAQYNYTFYGWAATPNGGADANWNKSITEDKTVYANFVAAVRYYTIRYYDGDTLLKSESLAYGTTPEYTAKKAGYDFVGWTPEIVPVAGNADYYAQWKELSGFSDVLTMVEANLPTSANGLKYGNIAINNAGTLIAFAFAGRHTSGNAPAIYNISGDAPTILSVPATGVASAVAFNYDDTELMVEGYNTSDYKHHLAQLDIDDLSSCSLASQVSVNSSSAIAYSPVADLFGYPYQISGANYNFVQRGHATIPFGDRINFAVYSPDGVHVALVGGDTVGAKIYNISGELVADASKFTSKNVKKVFYNSDGSLLAVSYGAAPWVEVYETINYTKVCDLSDIVSATAYAEFMGLDTLVIGTGTTVMVRTITETGHKAYEYDVPAYEESGDVVNIVKNHNSTRVVIQTTAKATVWALT